MANDQNESGAEPVYDLEERTACFGEAIVKFAKKVPQNQVTLPLITQLVRAGTSVGANYCEADDAVSRKELKTRSEHAKKKREKRNIGCE
jgi:four helix bundle protein